MGHERLHAFLALLPLPLQRHYLRGSPFQLFPGGCGIPTCVHKFYFIPFSPFVLCKKQPQINFKRWKVQ